MKARTWLPIALLAPGLLGTVRCGRQGAPPPVAARPPVQPREPWHWHGAGGLLVIEGELAAPDQLTLRGRTFTATCRAPLGPVRWELYRPPPGERVELRAGDGRLLARWDLDGPPPPAQPERPKVIGPPAATLEPARLPEPQTPPARPVTSGRKVVPVPPLAPLAGTKPHPAPSQVTLSPLPPAPRSVGVPAPPPRPPAAIQVTAPERAASAPPRSGPPAPSLPASHSLGPASGARPAVPVALAPAPVAVRTPVPVPGPTPVPRPRPGPEPAQVAPAPAAPAPEPGPAASEPAASEPAAPPAWPGAGEALNILRGPRGLRRICLTFDGGSSSETAADILDVLKAHGIRTTLFLTGAFIRNYPDLVRRMAQDGHELGNHTLDHPHFAPGMKRDPRWTKERFQAELLDADRALYRLLGRPMDPFWRAPYGEHTPELRRWAEEVGYRHVSWSDGADTLDWATSRDRRLYRSGPAIIQRLERRLGKPDGDGLIVLMHLGSLRPVADRPARYLGPFLDRMLREGWHFVSVGDYLKTMDRPPWERSRRLALLGPAAPASP